MSEERYEDGFTIAVYVPAGASREDVDALFQVVSATVPEGIRTDSGESDVFVFGRSGDVFQLERADPDYSPHIYLSTSCYHGNHGYCQTERGLFGLKTPACCKFCAAPCCCRCHAQMHNGEHDGNGTV